MFRKIFVIFFIVISMSQTGFPEDSLLNNIPSSVSQISSKIVRIKKQDFNEERIFIFEGNVHFNFRNAVNFSTDKLLVGVNAEDKIMYFEMVRNVSMEKEEIRVISQQAYSDDLNTYVDFAGNVTFSTNGSPVNVNKIRYSLITETFSVPEIMKQ